MDGEVLLQLKGALANGHPQFAHWTLLDPMHIINLVVSDTSNGVSGGHSPAEGWGWLPRGGTEELVVWLALLAILIAVAVYFVSKIRPHSAQQELDTHELMAKFRDLHSQGGLSDEEYRTIKSTVTEQLRHQLNDDDGKG